MFKDLPFDNDENENQEDKTHSLPAPKEAKRKSKSKPKATSGSVKATRVIREASATLKRLEYKTGISRLELLTRFHKQHSRLERNRLSKIERDTISKSRLDLQRQLTKCRRLNPLKHFGESVSNTVPLEFQSNNKYAARLLPIHGLGQYQSTAPTSLTRYTTMFDASHSGVAGSAFGRLTNGLKSLSIGAYINDMSAGNRSKVNDFVYGMFATFHPDSVKRKMREDRSR